MNSKKLNGKWLLVLIMLASGCASTTLVQQKLSFIPGIDDPTKTKVRLLRVVADRGANSNSATKLDVLFILDKRAEDRLPKTSQAWFLDRDNNINDVLDEVLVLPLGLAPGESIWVDMPKGSNKAESVKVFANYLPAKGQKLFKLPNSKAPVILLKPKSIQFTTEESLKK